MKNECRNLVSRGFRVGCRLRARGRNRLAITLILLSFLIALTAKAAIPLIAAVLPAAESAITGIAIRAAANDAIYTLGVAANDATWSAASSSLAGRVAAYFGIALAGYSSDLGGTKYAVPVSPNVPGTSLPKKSVSASELSSGLGYLDERVIYTFGSNFCSYGPGASPTFGGSTPHPSTDGQLHRLSKSSMSLVQLKQECDALRQFDAGLPFGSGRLYNGPLTITEISLNGNNGEYNAARPVRDIATNQYLYAGNWIIENCDSVGVCSYVRSQYDYSGTVVEGKDGIKRMGIGATTGFAPDTSDPDWSATDISNWSPATRILLSGKDQNNQDVLIAINYSDVSGVSVQTVTQKDAANVQYRDLSFDKAATPQITSVSERVVPGSVTTFYASNPGYATTTPAAVSTGGGSSTSVTFPDDYARQNTLQSADTHLGKIDDALTKTQEQSDPSEVTTDQFNSQFFPDTFSDLLGWRMPPHTSSCPVIDIDLSALDMGAFQINVHCTFWSENAALIASLFNILWVSLALFIVLGA